MPVSKGIVSVTGTTESCVTSYYNTQQRTETQRLGHVAQLRPRQKTPSRWRIPRQLPVHARPINSVSYVQLTRSADNLLCLVSA